MGGSNSTPGPPTGLGGGGPRANPKIGALQNGLCEGGRGTPPGNFEILHALKCILGAPEALFRARTQYIYTCKLPSSISGFRSKNTMYGALASRRRSVSSIKREAKQQVDHRLIYYVTGIGNAIT